MFRSKVPTLDKVSVDLMVVLGTTSMPYTFSGNEIDFAGNSRFTGGTGAFRGISSGDLPSDQRSIARWFDVKAFAIPSPQAYGNAGRNILRGPGSTNIDLALSKSFHWEGPGTRSLQIRSEFFNALNHTNLGLPIHSMDSLAVGTITSASSARVIQLGARLEF